MSDMDEQVTLARALANPDHETREQSLQSLQKLLHSKTDMTELEMAKLWKALHYCERTIHNVSFSSTMNYFAFHVCHVCFVRLMVK